MSRILAITAFALATIFHPAHSSNSAPTNLLIGKDRTEPVVAVDPRHPATVIIGANTNYDAPVGDTYPTAYFSSHDGGRSFHFGYAPIRRPFTTGADVAVAIGSRNSTAFYSYLGETPSYCSSGGAAVLLAHSTDGGRSFHGTKVVDSNSDDDKPYLAVESLARHPAHLFVTWARSHSQTDDIWYARSLDGGRSFSRPARLYSSRWDSFGSLPVVAPGGRIYTFWAVSHDNHPSRPSRAHILMRSSQDDGAHFGRTHSVAGTFWTVPDPDQPGSLRVSTGPTSVAGSNGTLYLAWGAATRTHRGGSVDADILVSRSTNHGASWSKGRPVNDVHRADRFMPAMTQLSDGSLGLAFYDRRNRPSHLDLYAVRASFKHGLRISPNVRLNRTYSAVSDIFYVRPGTCFDAGRFFGDYMGVASGPRDKFYASWADSQLHIHNETDLWLTKSELPRVR